MENTRNLTGGIILNKGTKLYIGKSIEMSSQKVYANERITLIYSGMLALSGADRIVAHYGYGDTWEEREYTEMTCRDGVFEAEISLKMPGSLHICFKDSAGNWDNNSCENYSIRVLSKKTAGKSKKAILAV